MKEQELLKKISGNDADTCTGCSNIREEGVVHDAAFTVPMTSWSSEQQKLIQSGHMTPFGTSGVNEKEGTLFLHKMYIIIGVVCNSCFWR